MTTLREKIVELRNEINEHLDKGYIPGPEFLPRIRDRFDEAINRDTIENLGRCIINDWCRGPLDHEGPCQPLENAEQIFDFNTSDGLVRVEITKQINKPLHCEVRHNGVLLFSGDAEQNLVIKPPVQQSLTSPESGDTPVE